MVLKPGNPHKIRLFWGSKSGGKSRKINQVLNQAINQGTTCRRQKSAIIRYVSGKGRCSKQ